MTRDELLHFHSIFKANWPVVWEFLKAHLEEVEIRSYKDHPEAKRRIELLSYEPQIKQCYDNSRIFSMEGGFDYVIGQMITLIPIDHAWNSIGDDFHFDLTEELVLQKDEKVYKPSPHFKIKTFSKYELIEWVCDKSNNAYPPDVGMFLNKLLREAEKKGNNASSSKEISE